MGRRNARYSVLPSSSVAHRGGWYRSRRTCPHTCLRRRPDHCRGPSLRPRSATRPSSVVRPPLTPAAPRLDFAIGVYEPRCPDPGCTDGSLVFRASPCTRAAPLTPPRLIACTPPDQDAMGMAFTVRSAARPSDCKYVEAADFTSCCGPHARSGSYHPARATAISRRAWGLLLDAPGLTEAGLPPAGDEQRETDDSQRVSYAAN